MVVTKVQLVWLVSITPPSSLNMSLRHMYFFIYWMQLLLSILFNRLLFLLGNSHIPKRGGSALHQLICDYTHTAGIMESAEWRVPQCQFRLAHVAFCPLVNQFCRSCFNRKRWQRSVPAAQWNSRGPSLGPPWLRSWPRGTRSPRSARPRGSRPSGERTNWKAFTNLWLNCHM